jgi:hypothetical protein
LVFTLNTYTLLGERNQHLYLRCRILRFRLHSSNRVCYVILLFFRFLTDFNAFGVSISYGRSLCILEEAGKKYIDTLRQAALNGKAICLVGDNVNYSTQVHDERLDHRGRMTHAFGSAAIIQHVSLLHDADDCSKQRVPPERYLPSATDWDNIRHVMVLLVCQAVRRHIPALSFLPCVTSLQGAAHIKSIVVPLPILHKNEQKYEDVMCIMDWYESLLSNIYLPCGIDIPKVQVGGDQLTRERLSGAKRLRATSPSENQRYMSPIVNYYFHLEMKILQHFFDVLHKSSSSTDIGTLSASILRLNRTSVKDDVKANFAACKDFAISFIDGHIVEGVMQFPWDGLHLRLAYAALATGDGRANKTQMGNGNYWPVCR